MPNPRPPRPQFSLSPPEGTRPLSFPLPDLPGGGFSLLGQRVHSKARTQYLQSMTPSTIALSLLVGTALVWIGSSWLEEAADKLSCYYHLPPGMQGGVIAAIGSSSPEIASVLSATLLHGEFDLGVSAIVGSAVFNILVIPAASVLVAGPQGTSRELLYRDAQFYLTSVSVLLVTFAMAVIYHPSPQDPMTGMMTRAYAAGPLMVYAIYLFIQHQDMVEDRELGQKREHEGEINPTRQWLRLVFGLCLLLVGVEGLVRGSIGLGDLLGTPSFLWGMTVIAAATSLPDTFVSIQAAKKPGGGAVNLSNVLGSNIFDLLVAVPLGVMVAGATPVKFDVATPMMGFLTLATIVFFLVLRTKCNINRTEAWVLLILYAIFIGWVGSETLGYTQLLGGGGLPSGGH